MEKEGFECEWKGEIGHLVLKKRSATFNSQTQLHWNGFSVSSDEVTFTQGKETLAESHRQAKGQLNVSCCHSLRDRRMTLAQAALWSPHRSSPSSGSSTENTGGGPDEASNATHPELSFPSRHARTLHTIPRDLVAQVWVTPESCWNDGLDQSESQRADTVSSLERAEGHGNKQSHWRGSFTHSPTHPLVHTTSVTYHLLSLL